MPAHEQLRGTICSDSRRFSFADYRMSTTTVVYFPYAPQQTVDTIKARFVAAGWTVPPQRLDSARGFVSSYGGTFADDVICRAGSSVVPTVMVRTINRSLAVINHQRSSPHPLCSRDAVRGYARMNPVEDTPLPSLPPPVGMRSTGSGSSGSPDRERAMMMSTSLEGPALLPYILEHYDKHFVAAGWRKRGQVLAESIGVANFEITSKGVTWLCSFVVTVPGSDAADVHLSLRMR